MFTVADRSRSAAGLPPVLLTLTVYVPAGTAPVLPMVSVELPGTAAIVAGAKLTVVVAGLPVAARVAAPLNPE
jgi:hypothetical protein